MIIFILSNNNKNKIMYGIIEEAGKIVKFTNATDLSKLAQLRVIYKMRQEGFEKSVDGIKKYLDSWIEWSHDMDTVFETREDAIGTAADTLVYSNIHFINIETKTELNSEDKKVLFESTVKFLRRGI